MRAAFSISAAPAWQPMPSPPCGATVARGFDTRLAADDFHLGAVVVSDFLGHPRHASS
jgi:hypothetical protein